MKLCPFCNAQIEEEARFCLYCMTSLDKKEAIADPPLRRRRWLWLVALAATVSVGLIAWSFGYLLSQPPSAPTGPVVDPSDVETTLAAQTETTVPTALAPVPDTASYRYREAQPGDMYSLQAPIPDGAVVITGVDTVSESGIYSIPARIDGRPVVAVMPHAFGDPSVCDTVKTVVFPASVCNVRDYAFIGCDNLTDIYLCGEAIYLATYAFPAPLDESDVLTVHCSQTCHNRFSRNYKEVAQWATGMVYQEWNGGELS